KRLRFRALKEMCSNAGLARRLGFYEVVGGSWRLGFDLLRRFQEVTPEEIKAVARKYLRRSNATIVWMERR
ncbi:MAG: insulinase family protein, partial [Planctomycetota bacterium]